MKMIYFKDVACNEKNLKNRLILSKKTNWGCKIGQIISTDRGRFTAKEPEAAETFDL